MARERNRILVNAAVFILLEAASLWALTASSKLHQSWLGHGATSIMTTLYAPFDHIGKYLSLREENDRLAAENMQLFEDLRKAQYAPAEDDGMWRTKGFNFEYLPAAIVSRSHNSQHNYVIVDRGWTDGVQEGDGIITPKGAVGIIYSAGTNFSYAITFNNTNVSVSAKLGRDGFVGNLAWNGHDEDKAVLSGIPLHANFEVGDTVYTSGHSSVFPADIPVATVDGSKIRGGSSAEIDVTLLEKLGRIHHVMVVKNNDREELEELTHE